MSNMSSGESLVGLLEKRHLPMTFHKRQIGIRHEKSGKIEEDRNKSEVENVDNDNTEPVIENEDEETVEHADIDHIQKPPAP